jgi:putative DNA primase/helicase
VEQPIVEVRVLGKSEMPKAVNRFCVFANGNNMTVHGDMTRRTLLSSMDRKTERPGEHRFQYDPVRAVLADRGKYVAACLTIVRAYFIAGRPEVTEMPMNSFGMWSDTVRSALIWLGCSDPCETIETARDNDPELQQLTQFILAFEKDIGIGRINAVSTSEIADMVHGKMQNMADYAHLREACTPFMQRGILNTTYLGKWLGRMKKRVVGELHIAKGAKNGANMWFLAGK